MWLSRWWNQLPREVRLATTSLCIALLPQVDAVNFQSAPSPNIDISNLGSVALAGNFDAVSLYNYVGQNEVGLSSNGSQSVLARFPDGGFANLGRADASILAMCSFQNQMVVAGNFTSLAGQASTGAALYDGNSGSVTPLPGLNGQVNALLCQDGTVYFGGLFAGGNATNAISWTTGWTNLPFAGFDGPVNAIQALPNGHIVYGGSFTGIGNGSITSHAPSNAQTVNIGSANITSFPNTTTHPGMSDPRNIICRTNEQSGSDWLLADDQAGFWRADFGFPFTPTKLRLFNSQTPGYGTQNWRYTFYPNSGIANFTYYTSDGEQTCDAECPLPNNNSTYQDFYFVNPIEMSGLRIDISSWYGNGGGLGGIELFQDEMYSYAINDFNEPQCDDVSMGSNSTVTGDWVTIYPPDNSYHYLSSFLPGDAGTHSTRPSVEFVPDLKQPGNYSVQVWTPGCLQDATCDSRGTVNITGQVVSGQGSGQNVSKTIVQTNNYDKYDEVYYGYMDAGSSSFRPSITLTPVASPGINSTIVASRVGFVLRNSTSSGLNGLYEYDPGQTTISSHNQNSVIDQAGTALNKNAVVQALAIINGETYAAGNFSSRGFSNVMVIRNGNVTSLPGQGLNQPVQTIYQDGDQAGATLYLGGNFTNTVDGKNPALLNVGAYNTSSQSWQPLGGGVNGVVHNIVPLQINVSSSEQQPALAVSGYFDQTLPFGTSPAVAVNNVAVWVPSRNNWLQNLGSGAIALLGHLSTQAGSGSDQLWGGDVDSQTLEVTGVTGVQNAGSGFGLQQLPLTIQPQRTSPQAGLQRRASTQQPVQGVATGLFYNENNLDITILGGHFTSKASNGSMIENLALVNGSSNSQVTGLAGNGSSDTAVLALEVSGTSLFAGGSISNGLVVYDLAAGQISASQPPALTGGSAVVEAIAARPTASTIFFGGSFSSAGSLPCNGLCIYDTSAKQWNQPPQPVGDDSIFNSLKWGSQTHLFMAGNFTLMGNGSTMAVFDAKANNYIPFPGSNDPINVPGPITAFSATDETYTSFFAAGVASNGSAFVTKFTSSSSSFPAPADGTWAPIISSQQFGAATEIQGVQIMPLQREHDSTDILASTQVLMLTGLLEIQGFGNASAAIFNGSTFEPFALSTMSDGTPGTLRSIFVANQGNLLMMPSTHHLAIGFVVLIALAIALALIFLVVVAGILAERIRRRREGYVPAPTGVPSYEKNGGNLGNISPERLFNAVGNGGSVRL